MLSLRIKKKTDGTGALTLTRADGTLTWQAQRSGHAQFFAYHDLTHYAVESVLGHRNGFLGLVAEGWDLDDFGTPWPRGPIPKDADPSEAIVGFLDAERASGRLWTAEEMAAFFDATWPGSQPRVTGADLTRIRAYRDELFGRWETIPSGEALELAFEVPSR